jgi:hypothetical protein
MEDDLLTITLQVLWSIIAACQAFINNRSSFWACRALLGLIEGGDSSNLFSF